MDGWMDEWMDGWMDGWKDGWTVGRKERRKEIGKKEWKEGRNEQMKARRTSKCNSKNGSFRLLVGMLYMLCGLNFWTSHCYFHQNHNQAFHKCFRAFLMLCIKFSCHCTCHCSDQHIYHHGHSTWRSAPPECIYVQVLAHSIPVCILSEQRAIMTKVFVAVTPIVATLGHFVNEVSICHHDIGLATILRLLQVCHGKGIPGIYPVWDIFHMRFLFLCESHATVVSVWHVIIAHLLRV